jgi:hypothetical protein
MLFAPTLLLVTIALADPTVGGPPVDTELARTLLSELGSRFSADYGKNFCVISDSADQSENIMRTADDVYQRVIELAGRLELGTTRPAKKMTVVFFSKWEDYKRSGAASGFSVNENAPGFFDHKSGVCFGYDYANSSLMREKRTVLDTARARFNADRDAGILSNLNEEQLGQRLAAIVQMTNALFEHENLINQTVIRHELAHQSLTNLGIQTPRMKDLRWLCEGLATQFESVSGINANRLADFRDIDWSDPKLTVRTLITDSKLLGPGAEQPSVGYAAAWGLVHYLINEKPREFAAYVRLFQQPQTDGPSPADSDSAAFEKCFGRPDAKFQLAWLEYMSALK